MEAIALHAASTFGGAQFYISCGQVEVTNGGSGTPGPLVEIPGVYTGEVRPLHYSLDGVIFNFLCYRSRASSSTSITPSQRLTLSLVR